MAIAVQATTSGLSASLAILAVLLGMAIVAIAVLATAVSLINSLNSSLSQSQAYGFIFFPIIVPFFLYLGSVSGAFLVMFVYRQGSGGLPLIPWLMSRFLAVIVTVALTVFLPVLILSSSHQTQNKTNNQTNNQTTEILSNETSDDTSHQASTSQPKTTAAHSFAESTSLLWLQVGILIQGLASAGLGSYLSRWLFQTLLKSH